MTQQIERMTQNGKVCKTISVLYFKQDSNRNLDVIITSLHSLDPRLLQRRNSPAGGVKPATFNRIRNSIGGVI